ncbi:MAG: GNAT family N-acetyltransferase [Clostridia bacterium]|nr:GNAT family N-acetyltransferase [Clostridia bacterium]
MVKVFPLRDTYAEKFKDMFMVYYLELGCEENGAHLAEEYVIPDMLAGLLRVDIIEEDGNICGFCIYQTDSKENEWNFKEGFGDIREIYIESDCRKKGLGKFILYTAEMKLKESGVKEIYTLADGDAAGFFAACGYELTSEECEELDCNVYLKTASACGCSCK